MSDLNGQQFDGLFPADHPAMRERSHAEMSTEQFRTLPGAYHHATYRASMPEKSTGSGSAGIHLGTRKAAMERVDDMGGRDPNLADVTAPPDKPADIHVRRLLPEHQPRTGRDLGTDAMRGTPDRAREDRGEDWGESPAAKAGVGEFYQNTHEDEGSISIRVPKAKGYLDSHRSAVDAAVRSGSPVHPEAQAALKHGSMDTPEPYSAGSQDDSAAPYARYQQRRSIEPSSSDNRNAGMLLPYKMEAVKYGINEETIPDPSGVDKVRKVPTVTFAASQEDADALTSQTYKTVMGVKRPKWEQKTGKY